MRSELDGDPKPGAAPVGFAARVVVQGQPAVDEIPLEQLVAPDARPAQVRAAKPVRVLRTKDGVPSKLVQRPSRQHKSNMGQGANGSRWTPAWHGALSHTKTGG